MSGWASLLAFPGDSLPPTLAPHPRSGDPTLYSWAAAALLYKDTSSLVFLLGPSEEGL